MHWPVHGLDLGSNSMPISQLLSQLSARAFTRSAPNADREITIVHRYTDLATGVYHYQASNLKIFTEYADEIYNASLYTDKSYSAAVKKVDLYPDIKHMTFDDDEVKVQH